MNAPTNPLDETMKQGETAMPTAKTDEHAKKFAADLKLLIGQASDRNDTRALYALNQQSLGAFYATGDDGFREIANYACECVTRIQRRDRPAPTQH